MIQYVDTFKDRFGVEAICRTLGATECGFVTDGHSRRIVGWNVASTLQVDVLPLQALGMAAWDAGGDLTGVIHHADHDSNYLSIVYTDRIIELATLKWVWWWNNQRLHGELGHRTPNEIEAEYYAGLESPRLAPASHGKH